MQGKSEGLLKRNWVVKMVELKIKTTQRNQLVDVTEKIQEAVKKSKVKEGICIVYCPHTTAAVTINENADPSVQADIIKKLNELVPAGAGYSHTEGNADAHIKSAIIGNSRIIPIKENRLALGAWEGCVFCEFDGPRDRRLLISILRE
jgi:secondary thiamine-phosphate synthase enzyme